MNISWTDDLPSRPVAHAIPLLRVRDKPVIGYASMAKPIGVYVHYYRGRTKPHIIGSDCPACADGHSAKWKGYLAMY